MICFCADIVIAAGIAFRRHRGLDTNHHCLRLHIMIIRGLIIIESIHILAVLETHIPYPKSSRNGSGTFGKCVECMAWTIAT